MSYGLLNWWWGEDTEESEWSWLIAHLNEIVEDVKPERKTKYLTLLMQHHTEQNQGWLDFRFLPFSYDRSYYDIDTVEGVTNIANWMEQNIRLPLDVEGNYDTIANDTITAFVKALRTHRPFYEGNIKGGEPFVWIPKLPWQASHLWYGPDLDLTSLLLNGSNLNPKEAELRDKIDRLMVDIGQGYICINPEANRVITHFLSDNFTDYFETVADTADWDYPKWYLDGSPL
tara:strand:- start:28866 stop:29555 length:690 start_codon:yes stop_codon:yes gene_type:complete